MHVPRFPPPNAREPAINVPGPLLGIVGALLLIHAGRLLLTDQDDLRLVLEAAFIPGAWSIASGFADGQAVVEAAAGTGQGREALAQYVALAPLRPWSVLSYALLHGSWAHVGLNCLWLVAFGSSVFRRAGAARSFLLAVVAALGGAAAQWLAGPLGADIVIGASASVSGFMAAAATFVFGRPAPGGGRWHFLRQRGALTFLGLWLVANLLFAHLAEPLGVADGEVAWQAHMGGLLAGLLLFPLLDPAWSRDRPRFPS